MSSQEVKQKVFVVADLQIIEESPIVLGEDLHFPSALQVLYIIVKQVVLPLV